MSDGFAPSLKDLAKTGIGVAAAPTGGMGLALGENGIIPDSVTGLFLPWLVDVDVFSTAVSSTNWDSLAQDSADVYAARKDSTGVQSAEINFDIVLAAGTWTFELTYHKNPDAGIITVQLGGISLGTIDTYAAAQTRNNRTSITGFSVAATGKARLKLVMSTKNAASTSYAGRIQHIQFRRTV